MNTRVIFCSLLVVGLWIGAQADCGAQLASSVTIDIPSPKIIKTLWVDSLYSYSTNMGDSFSVKFSGTNNGTASWVIGDNVIKSEVTLSISSDGVSTTPNAPSAAATSTSNSLTISVTRLLVAVCGSAVALVVVLCLSSMNMIESKADPPCKEASVEIQIPSGKVQKICNTDTGDCACGPDYSGPNCNYYKSKCIPTPQQLANRLSNVTLNPKNIPLPDPGQSFCDSNFGTEIWRVSNREQFTDPNQAYFASDPAKLADQRIHIIGLTGFSPNLKYAVSTTTQGSYIYEINVDEYNVPHINATKRIMMFFGFQETENLVIVDPGNGAWMTDQHYMFVYGDKVYSIDVEAPLIRGGLNVTTIGDLSPFTQNNYYSEPLTGFNRCTSSRRRPDGSIRMMCDIGYGVTALGAPDPNRVDSHSPNATCINAAYFDGASARVGYLVFDVMSATPVDRSTNIKLYARFINGVDSDAWYCFQSGRQWSSELNDYRTWVIYNPLNNGYKLNLDRSGEWFASAGAIDNPATAHWTVGLQPGYKVKMDPYSVGGGVVKGFVNDWEGHGAQGWAEVMMQSGAPEPCDWCIGYINFTTFGDDDPGKIFFTNIIAPAYQGKPPSSWIYDNGLYASYFHATPRTAGECIMQSGLDCGKWDCTIVPRANEVWHVTTAADGTGTLERIASTRDTLHSLYAIVTSECEDETGPCWALFQSSWGVNHASAESVVPSDIFMVRFR